MEATLSDYKLSCELLGHSMDVRAVAAGSISAESSGQAIVSGSRDKTMKVWRREGKEYSEGITYQDHKNFVSCVFYLQSCKWLCSGSNDATICIYPEGGYVPILVLKGHDSTVCSLAEGVEPQSLISGSWDKTARIWTIDQMGGISSVVLRGHEAAVWAVATMPAVKKFITGSADKCIYYWNAKGEKLRMLKGHTDCVRSILTLPDNSLVSCANDAIIRYWNEDGECVQELSGHTNYIYALAQNTTLGDKVVVSCGEDSTLRMWDVAKGVELGNAIVHPAQSVWSVACLSNGDIVTGSSDGVVRVFTKDPTRYANEVARAAFEVAVNARKEQMNEELGGVKKTDLPGPEALLSNGTREGQTKMIRHADGSVKCYAWELGKWNLVGDVTGASGGTQNSSGKVLHEGKEYDFVFSVDISDTEPPIKLPYNHGEDPWHAAQKFIHRHNLPQVYLDQVANFIVKNSGSAALSMQAQPTSSGYQDPFTGGARYVPGSASNSYQSVGNADPFTGASSYTTAASRTQPRVDVNFVKGPGDKHFPVSKYLSFDACDAAKILVKLKEFNQTLQGTNAYVPEVVLELVIKFADTAPLANGEAIDGLSQLLEWPKEKLFPVIDVVRLAVRHEEIFLLLESKNFVQRLLPHLSSSAPNQLMIIRCLANMMTHAAGRRVLVNMLPQLCDKINFIKTGSANLQIAIATFFLNITIMETMTKAESQICQLATEGIIELLKWCTDLEACYRSMQAIGNITTTPYGQESAALVISVDYVMDKIRELTNTPQTDVFKKLNALGTQLLASF